MNPVSNSFGSWISYMYLLFLLCIYLTHYLFLFHNVYFQFLMYFRSTQYCETKNHDWIMIHDYRSTVRSSVKGRTMTVNPTPSAFFNHYSTFSASTISLSFIFEKILSLVFLVKMSAKLSSDFTNFKTMFYNSSLSRIPGVVKAYIPDICYVLDIMQIQATKYWKS